MHTSTITRTFHERTARDCYDWIAPEDVVRIALGSFYALCRELDELPDDPTEEYAEFTNGRAWLAEDLSRVFLMRLNDIGYRAGAPGFDPDDSRRLALRFGPPSPDSPPPYQSENPAGRRLKASSVSLESPNTGPRQDIHRAQYESNRWRPFKVAYALENQLFCDCPDCGRIGGFDQPRWS